MNIVTSSFSKKIRFQNDFRLRTLKRKRGVFKFFRFAELRYQSRISVSGSRRWAPDGRPNRRNKAAFTNGHVHEA